MMYQPLKQNLKMPTLTMPGYTGSSAAPSPKPVANTICLTSLNTRSPSGRLITTVHLEPEPSGAALVTVEDVGV
jgi:hypothetical protein